MDPNLWLLVEESDYQSAKRNRIMCHPDWSRIHTPIHTQMSLIQSEQLYNLYYCMVRLNDRINFVFRYLLGDILVCFV